jgi:hypothetical protein
VSDERLRGKERQDTEIVDPPPDNGDVAEFLFTESFVR